MLARGWREGGLGRARKWISTCMEGGGGKPADPPANASGGVAELQTLKTNVSISYVRNIKPMSNTNGKQGLCNKHEFGLYIPSPIDFLTKHIK